MSTGALVEAVKYAVSVQQAGWGPAEVSVAIETHLKSFGYSIEGGMEDPLPLRAQGAIELHDILENFIAQDFTRTEAFELLKTILKADGRKYG